MGLKVGDIVALKSGGPLMTVVHVYVEHPGSDRASPGNVRCSYFRADGVYVNELGFPQESLRTVEAEPYDSIPAAIMRAKDAEAEAMKAERERQWEEDQVRYAHTTGFLINEGAGPGVTPDDHG